MIKIILPVLLLLAAAGLGSIISWEVPWLVLGTFFAGFAFRQALLIFDRERDGSYK